MRHLFPLAALLLGSACNASSEEANDHQTEKSAPRIAPTPNSVEAQAQVSDIIGNASEPELRWTGRFAATKALCKTEAWEIGETRVLVAPGSSCDVDRVARAA
ncbi:MAG TPA: hypothetical protein VNT25_05485, partial [Allosphingosinicella sp.]|nr:hypothetical protein [Allosphingosinicella sp.]